MVKTVIKLVLHTSLSLLLLTALIYAEGNGDRDWGFNCDIPVEVHFNSLMGSTYVSNKSTCGMIDDYSATCLGNYDGGEDVIYRIEIDFTGVFPFQFSLDPMGSGWTGMVLSTECPDGGTGFEDCLAYSVNEGSDPYFFEVMLSGPATYYLMIDTWPSPDCIPEYELQITNMYDKCDSAVPVHMPEDAPYIDLNQTNCGLNDFYHETCMGNYDTGEEKLYKILVAETGEYRFNFDPKGTNFAGIAVSGYSICPPTRCIAFYSNMTGDKIQFNLTLEPNTYFLMIDTWTSPDCIPDYDLIIDIIIPPPLCGDVSGDGEVSISDAVYIIDFIFTSGPPPEPIQIGDVNCDEDVNVSDAVWIINYIFIGGNQPCDTDGNDVPNC